MTLSISPTPVSLMESQVQAFTPTITGSVNTAVTWSLNPAVGSIDINGNYTAPGVISTAQTVTVTCTSAANTSVTATATINLIPVSVSMSPTSANLGPSQTQQFTPAVSGATNSAVIWSLSPAMGSVNNGLYTAPSVIATTQPVTITATSAQDGTEFASATILLQPPAATVAVSVTPASASLQASGTQQFTATVTGNSNTAVTWSLSPNVGTISTTGLYTAPTSVAATQPVTVTATSVADTTKTSQVTVTLNPTTGPAPLTLPIEVMGANGTIVSAVVNAPTVPAGSHTMQMRIHGLKYETEASVQVNGSAWVPLNTATVTLLGNAKAYGGIGGGFSTLDLTVPLPAGAIVAGNNTVKFQFIATDGRTSGFRVLSFNFLDPNGNSLIPAAAFVQDDPTTWQPPLNDAADIASGQALWRGAALTTPQSTGPVPIQANCMSCHTQDGRDLKYFNYSNNSIIARSVFHGLTTQQGQQIASYIRSLSVNNPGRPWNPPYQPGPGLDSAPVNQWAAGAGLDAVVASNQDQLNDLFPNGIQSSVFSPSGKLSQRQIRTTFQLLDWNQWLPSVHPMDAFGTTFTTSSYLTTYQALRAALVVGNAAVYGSYSVKTLFNSFGDGRQALWNSLYSIRSNPANWTAYNTDAFYSLLLWGLVKSWELNNEFQLEGLAQAFYGPTGEPRAWAGDFPFFVSPNISGIPATNLKNGLQTTHDYVAFAWYHLQLLLNDSNGQQVDTNPIDWGYAYEMISTVGRMVSPSDALQMEWMTRALQTQGSFKSPDVNIGWQWSLTNPFWLVRVDTNIWDSEQMATRTALAQAYLSGWLAEVSQYTPQQLYSSGEASATQVPNPGFYNVMTATPRFIDSVWYTLPQLRYIGVNQTLINQAAAWAQTVWPQANWAATTTATCTLVGTAPVCSTE